MAQRGPYAKGVIKREEILDAALAIVAEHGYSRTTVDQLARAVGLSRTGLLRYFGSKDLLFLAVLRRRDTTDLTDAAYAGPAGTSPERLAAVVAGMTEVPGLVQVYARLSGEAAEPEHPAHEYFQQRYAVVRSLWTGALESMQEDGRIAADVDPAELAVVATALVDGLRTQWMYEPTMDVEKSVLLLLKSIAPPPQE